MFVSAQTKTTDYKELFYQAEILEQNTLYEEAKRYYYDALNALPHTSQYRNIKTQIRGKILTMESYQRFHHLWGQGEQLENLQDFESAHKYYSDALQYAADEKLNIPDMDHLKSRVQVVAETSDLYKSLCMMELLNLEGDYAQARGMYFQWVDYAESLRYKWKKYEFPADFVQKMDSVVDFLEEERNVTLPYRSVFPEDYMTMNNYLFQLLDQTACQNPHTIESDITFVFSLDTNGVVQPYIIGNKLDDRFNDALSEELRHIQMSQPHRYGFSLPVKEEIRYHISTTQASIWVKKTQKGYKVKEEKWNKLYKDEFRTQLKSAPNGQYCFQIHRNIIDDQVRSSVRITKAKGGKAKKWFKTKK